MKKINHRQLQDFGRVAYNTRTPAFVWGTMGIGKSQAVKQLAKDIAKDSKLEFHDNEVDGDKSFCFIDVRISQLEPSDLRGLPTVEDGKTRWLPPSWLPQSSKSKGILFFDELNLAPPSIQAAAYQLILDRRLGEYKLPEGWVIISAGNTSDDRANIFDLPAPLANRFIHIELEIPTKEEWNEWALKNNIHGSITSFLELKPSFLYTFSRKAKDKSFATPRTWEYVNRLLRGAEKVNLEEVETLVAAAVGEGIATEYCAFLRLQKQINLAEILDNPESAKNIKGIDLRHSLIGALVEKYREQPKLIGKIMEVSLHIEPEFATLLLRNMKGANMDYFISNARQQTSWRTVFTKYGKYLIDMKE